MSDEQMVQAADGQGWSSATPAPLVRMPIRLGYVFIALFFGGLGTWAALADIASAAVAGGVVSPEGNRKTIQHLEGGLIEAILVHEGDSVQEGDPVVVLQRVQAHAAFKVLENRRRLLVAMRERLLAEQTRKETVHFPEWLIVAARDDAQLQTTLDAQSDLFTTQRTLQEGRKAIGRKRIDELREEISGRKSMANSQRRRLALLAEEVDAKKPLADKGLIARPEYLQIARMSAEVEAEIAQNDAAIAQAKQSIGETELQIVNEDSRMMDEIANELAETRSELSAVEERLFAQQDILDRTVVTTPVSGHVVNLRFHTAGGVLAPGEPIMDIVPQDAELLIDARVRPVDIDEVASGQAARIHFLALVERRLPQINGVVRSVSADSLMDEVTGEVYFLARVEVPPSELAKIGTGSKITPGMPADVLIVTGERTFLEYLVQPLVESVRRSFRES